MISLDRYEVFNLENALRGMRNPLNSWGKSDSYIVECDECDQNISSCDAMCYQIGESDMGLCKRLIGAGTEHRKFMRQIMVSVDITAPLYWYKEFDTYKVGTTANSTSTMHKIHSKPIELSDFSMDHAEDVHIEALFEATVNSCEWLRKKYIDTNDKKYWLALVQLLPSSYNQMRTVTLNYEVLMNMYHQRRLHKLNEWHVFCDWILNLPYMSEFMGIEL